MGQRILSVWAGWVGHVPIEGLALKLCCQGRGQIAVRVNQAKTNATFCILQLHIEQQGGFPGPGLADDVCMHQAIGLANAKGKVAIATMRHAKLGGPLSSAHLHALTKDTHRCRDTSLRQLQKLRAGGFLMLPRQQRLTENADFNPYIYDLAKHARNRLIDLGLAEPTVRPTGHWGHGSAVSSVTSAIEIAAGCEGVRYIPAHIILAIKQAPLAVCIGGRKLIPDQLFALDYGGMYRAVVLEVDRGTEPKTSSAARKSYASSIELYRRMIEQNLHRAHYGLKATMLILWVFTLRSNEQRFLEMVGQIGGQAKGLICTQVMPDTRATLATIGPYYDGEWARCQNGPVLLSRSGLNTG